MPFVKLLHNSPSKDRVFLPHVTEIKQPHPRGLNTWKPMIKSNGMTTQHRGYTTEAAANQSEGMWAADVLIWPTLRGFANMLVDKG